MRGRFAILVALPMSLLMALLAACAGTGQVVNLNIDTLPSEEAGLESVGQSDRLTIRIKPFEDQRPTKETLGVRTHLGGGTTIFQVGGGPAAEVTANSLVRMARAAGFEGYEDLRRPFREALRTGRENFPDRARWLQGIARGGRHARLFGQMATMTLENCEQLFSDTTAEEVKSAADRIVAARTTYVLGVGISYALAHNFAYLARMALDTVVAVPRDGSLPIDDLARAGPEDVVLAMTFKPYRSEVVDAGPVAMPFEEIAAVSLACIKADRSLQTGEDYEI